MSVVVIDFGMSNLGSVRRSLEECGARVVIAEHPEALKQASHAVLPGVGAFARGMENLRTRGWLPAIRELALEDRVPFLGVCLGMQLLAETGHEGGTTEGLGLVAGEVRRLEPGSPEERVPHVGWNEVYPVADGPMFANIPTGSDFYFVHSYHLVPREDAQFAAYTPYCGRTAAAVVAGNVWGVQFHPEKSSRAGFQLLRNFLAM